MNLRNRTFVIVIRTLLGLMLVFSGLSGLWAGFHGLEGIPAPMLESTRQLWGMGIFQMIKVTETVSGLMLVFGFRPWLAAIFISPICVGIIVFDVGVGVGFAYMISGFVLSAMTALLGYAYWDKYKQLFAKA